MNFMLGVQGIRRALNNNKFSRHPEYCFSARAVTYRTLRTPHLKNIRPPHRPCVASVLLCSIPCSNAGDKKQPITADKIINIDAASTSSPK
jgi:hypothetical protein